MEIKVFLNWDAYIQNKAVYCVKVSCPDVFSYESFISLAKSIYGKDSICVFVCV